MKYNLVEDTAAQYDASTVVIIFGIVIMFMVALLFVGLAGIR
ncbi:MAG: hypothetical protein ACXQTE_04930 [Methanosarcinaceae archaeon]